jgi:23S rRNA pseudouridine1911/1915/1917 synthase
MAAPDPRRVDAARRRLAEKGVEVLLEDNHLLVVAKPAGLLAQGDARRAASLVDLLAAYRREAEGKPGAAFVGLVHRLDRDVSGVVLTARTSKAAARLAALFRDRDARLEKRYLAWVEGVPDQASGEAQAHLVRRDRVARVAQADDENAREAHLTWRLDGAGARTARLEVRLHTGRTHQIRAQLADAGHPLLGDPTYGGRAGKRIALHAWRLAFPHPIGGARVEVEAAVPSDLCALDRRLGIAPPLASA